MTATARRPPIFGPEPWGTVAGAEWCHFDCWYALTTVSQFDGDLGALEREMASRRRASVSGRRDLEAKLSHLADLRARLAAAGLPVGALAAAADPDKTTLVKARRKVLDHALEWRSLTPAMRETPRVQLVRRARYGHWDQFPISPASWHAKLQGRLPTAQISKGQSFGATRQLRERLERLDAPRLAPSDRLALYRAIQTVGVELAECADDSYGVVGELRLEAFTEYIRIDWADAGMAPEHWWQDLCEILVSEEYALTFRNETLPFLHVPAGQADLIEAILLALADEWRAAYQDYEADKALELIAWLHIAGHRYLRYADAARRLGSDHWVPVVALAESALASGRREVALAVFDAADQEGMHRAYLRERSRSLLGADG